ncbi:MAG TPA: tyrosine-protein phosphatase [Acidimicrobiales bacterium]|nr:tyrosine-protein phosphatase [Acidimicrobiales bacterium]
MSSTGAHPARRIELGHAFNLRDIGGYATGTGATAWRRVFRADGVHRLSAVDAVRLREQLGVRTVIDLRTFAERETSGCFACDGVATIHLPMLRKTWDGEVTDDDEPEAFLAGRYLLMLEEGREAIAAAMEIVASPHRRPVLFHCSVGKDRTGVLAALLLELLGVGDDDIAGDYALSAEAMERLRDWARLHQPAALDAMTAQAAAILTAPVEAMHRFLDELRRRHGSAEGYLSAAGVPSRAISALRRDLVDHASPPPALRDVDGHVPLK